MCCYLDVSNRGRHDRGCSMLTATRTLLLAATFQKFVTCARARTFRQDATARLPASALQRWEVCNGTFDASN